MANKQLLILGISIAVVSAMAIFVAQFHPPTGEVAENRIEVTLSKSRTEPIDVLREVIGRIPGMDTFSLLASPREAYPNASSPANWGVSRWGGYTYPLSHNPENPAHTYRLLYKIGRRDALVVSDQDICSMEAQFADDVQIATGIQEEIGTDDVNVIVLELLSRYLSIDNGYSLIDRSDSYLYTVQEEISDKEMIWVRRVNSIPLRYPFSRATSTRSGIINGVSISYASHYVKSGRLFIRGLVIGVRCIANIYDDGDLEKSRGEVYRLTYDSAMRIFIKEENKYYTERRSLGYTFTVVAISNGIVPIRRENIHENSALESFKFAPASQFLIRIQSPGTETGPIVSSMVVDSMSGKVLMNTTERI